MTITCHGLRRAQKRKGATRQGTKIFLVESDTAVGDDIDSVLDQTDLPGYYDPWDATTDPYLRVATKSASAHDRTEGADEGYFWEVTVSYEQYNSETSEDPTDWDWDWSKKSVARKKFITTSTHDTSGYIAPGKAAGDMVYRDEGEPLTNTADKFMEAEAFRTIALQEVTLVKYLEPSKWSTDIGVASSHAMDEFAYSTNDGTVELLGHTYEKFELEMSDISYKPVVKNGYNVIELNLSILIDEYFKHVLAYVSAGHEQRTVAGDGWEEIFSAEDGGRPMRPEPLDKNGRYIPMQATGVPRDVVVVAAGDHTLKDWSGLNLPATE